MTDINLIRDLNAYKKMYNHLFNAVTDAIRLCTASDVKNILVKAQQYTESIYLGENNTNEISIDEETIVDLLTLLINIEREKPVSQQDGDFIEECNDWIFDLQKARAKDIGFELVKNK